MQRNDCITITAMLCVAVMGCFATYCGVEGAFMVSIAIISGIAGLMIPTPKLLEAAEPKTPSVEIGTVEEIGCTENIFIDKKTEEELKAECET